MRAFRTLYQEHYGFVWSTVRRMGVRPDAIDDAVQDAFLVVFRRWDDLPSERRRAWLYGIARRVSSNARKVERRRVRKHDALRHAHARRVEVVGRLEAATALERFLGQLTADDRELFVLGAVEGMTGKELSTALGAPASTLYGRLQALRRQFRAEAGEEAERAVERARTQRPRASAASWAVLLPKLGIAGAGVGSLGIAMGGVAAAAALLGTVAVAAPPESVSPARPIRSATLEPHAGPVAPAAHSRTSAPEPAPAPAPAPVPAPVLERPAASSRVVLSRPDPLAAEAALVQQIRDRVQAGEGEVALRLIARHVRRHSRGALSDVVVALEVEALCDLGRHADAQARAAALLHDHPETPVALRVSRACGSKELDASSVETPKGGHGEE